MKKSINWLLAVVVVAAPAHAGEKKRRSMLEYEEYKQTIARTALMVNDPNARSLVRKHGLSLVNVMWEDTGRYKGSAVGPNISDVTIQVQQMNPLNEQSQLSLMPVIRYPNFSDKTADLAPDRFYLLVGNEKGKPLRRITLTEYLDEFRKYLTRPGSWKGNRKSLLAPRDTHVLVSAQACFLPVPKGRMAEFNVAIFNYQSYRKNPAVLTILATREGTSATIVDNFRNSFRVGYRRAQRLFFNVNGSRAPLTAQRISDFVKEEATRKNPGRGGQGMASSAAAGDQKGLNMVLLIQVPLQQRSRRRAKGLAVNEMALNKAARSDTEDAVIGHGRIEGPFTEIDDLEIVRDHRFPVRVTVQFYKATSTGHVSEEDVREIRRQIDKVYARADHVGSLVVEGMTGRPTEYEGPKFEPPGWWAEFWRRFEAGTGRGKREALARLERAYGRSWTRMASETGKFLEAVKIAYENDSSAVKVAGFKPSGSFWRYDDAWSVSQGGSTLWPYVALGTLVLLLVAVVAMRRAG